MHLPDEADLQLFYLKKAKLCAGETGRHRLFWRY